MTKEEQALNKLIETVLYLIDQKDNSTKIQNVLVKSSDGNGLYTVTYGGIDYQVPLYGTNTITVNKSAKLFVPSNNLSLAFIM